MFTTIDHTKVAQAIQNGKHTLSGPEDLDPLIEIIGDARFVLLGEATHGTHEYSSTWIRRKHCILCTFCLQGGKLRRPSFSDFS